MSVYEQLSLFQKIEAGGVIPLGGLMMLAAFVPALSLVAVWIKATSEPARLKAAVKLYQIEGDKYYQAFLEQRRPSIVKQTCIPIIVMTIVNAYFALLMIYTPAVLRAPEFMSNFLLLGSNYGTPRSVETDQYMLQTIDAMCYAYLGWYVWAVATIFARVTTMELVPATYYSLLIRLAVAIFVAVVFRHLHVLLLPAGARFFPEAVGFAAGLFPDSMLQFMTRQMRRYFLGDAGLVNEYPLDLIQGISPYRKLRLQEIGLDNCINLAASNPLNLYLASNLNLIEVIDWIAQAQLLILVGPEKFALLQANAYRTTIDLDRALGSPAKARLIELLGFTSEQLDDLRDGMNRDPDFVRISGLHRVID